MMSVETTRLLEGEDPTTTHPGDATHWVHIYGELLDFKRRLIARAEDEAAVLGPVAQRGALRDVDLLSDQMSRFEDRLEFWLRRERELRGLTIDEETGTIGFQGSRLRLTPRELALFQTLLRAGGRPLTARRLIVEAWRDSTLSSEQLRLYIARLRAKLQTLGGIAIVREPGQGYALHFLEDGDGADPG